MSKYMVLSAALMILAAPALLPPAMGGVLVEWQVTSGPNEETSADWSADGENIIYDYRVIPGNDYEVWMCPASGGPGEPLITGPGNQNLAEWSVNNEIVFISDHEGDYDIYVVPAAGGTWQQITTDPATDWYPAWSPDGQWIAFQSDRSGNEDIWVVPADLSEAPRQITFDTADDGWPTWSPDGTEIAFTSARSHPAGHLWIKPIAPGSQARQLTTTDGGGDWHPDWGINDDTEVIVFENWASDIWFVPADGSAAPEHLTFFHGQDSQATLSPDGSRVAYETSRSGGFFDVWACIFDRPIAVSGAPAPPRWAVLGQNEPNPFNPTTTIRIDLDEGVSNARLEIFDAQGSRVRSIPLAAGGPSEMAVNWDGLNDEGSRLPSGAYFYRVAYDGGATNARKAVLLK